MTPRRDSAFQPGLRWSAGQVRQLTESSGLNEIFWWLAERLDPNLKLSWSQDGEDMLLRRHFGDKANGFYVDVGAHHPIRFSNTCHFYRRGWRGINIDANPAAIAPFQKHRRRDINLCTGIAASEGHLLFHRFNEPALDTFDPALAADRAALPDYHLVDRVEVPVVTLARLLGEHLPHGQRIDFMSIDVEGFDLQVLQSNDWTRFKPRVLLVEVRGTCIDELADDNSCKFVRSLGYRAIGKTANTVLFAEPGF